MRRILDKKAQNIMQMLMTYGWAIFVLATVIAALVMFGIFDPAVVLPDRVDVGQVVAVKDFKVSENSVTFTFENRLGKPIYDFKVRILSCNNGEGVESSPIRMGTGQTKQVTVNCVTNKPLDSVFASQLITSYSTRSGVDGSAAQNYLSSTNNYMNHSESGSLRAVVQAGLTGDHDETVDTSCDHNITACTDDDANGYWIPGDTYCLKNDINNFQGTCLRINASNITVLGMGHTIDGADNGTYDDGIIYGDIYANNIFTGLIIRDINIQEFGIRSGDGSGSGLFMSNVENTIIFNSSFNSNTNGIIIQNSSSVVLTNVTANSNTLDGIQVDQGTANRISGLTANSNGEYGLFVNTASGNSFTDVTANSNIDNGIIFISSSHNTLSGVTANSNENNGIDIHSSSNYNNLSVITANSNFHDGIDIYNSSSNNLSSITAHSNIYGINLFTNSNNIISNANTTSNDIGIYLYGSLGNTISNIISNSNSEYGISLSGSSNNQISDITVTSNGEGIVLDGSDGNNLNNIIGSYNAYGIHFASNSNSLSNSTFNSNTISGIKNEFSFITVNHVAALDNPTDFDCVDVIGSGASGANNIFNVVNECPNGWPELNVDYFLQPPTYWWCNGTDINHNGIVNLADYNVLVDHWLWTNCSLLGNYWCNWSDLNRDGTANQTDYDIILAHWFEIGCHGGITCDVYITSCTQTQDVGFWQSGTNYCISDDINLGEEGVCMTIDADTLALNGLGHTLNGINNNEFIKISSRSGINITNITMTDDAYTCIAISASSNIVLDELSLACYSGVSLASSNYITIQNINIGVTDGSTGILLNSSDFNNITNVSMWTSIENSPDTYGLKLISSSDRNIIRNLHIENIENGVHVIDSTLNNFTNLNLSLLLSETNNGMFFTSSTQNNLTNINVTGANSGIFLSSDANYNSLSLINASNNNYGVRLNDCYNDNLTNILANSNEDNGIEIIASSNIKLINATANSNYVGILSDSSDYVNITSSVTNYNHVGIYLESTQYNRLINITSNYSDGWGMYIDGGSNIVINGTVCHSPPDNEDMHCSDPSTASDLGLIYDTSSCSWITSPAGTCS